MSLQISLAEDEPHEGNQHMAWAHDAHWGLSVPPHLPLHANVTKEEEHLGFGEGLLSKLKQSGDHVILGIDADSGAPRRQG